MIQSLFIIDRYGEVLIEKHWRGITSRSLCDSFWEAVIKAPRREDVEPVIPTPKHYLINVYRDSMYFVAAVGAEIPPLMVIEFLHRVVDTFTVYFGKLDEDVVRANFSSVYQLLEEMLDHGFPVTTELNSLQSLVNPPSLLGNITASVTGTSGVSDELGAGMLSNTPWRKANAKYSQNEVFFDIVEEMDAIVDAKGRVITCEVTGTMICNCRLSGMPNIAINFINPHVLDVDRVSLHPCVRFGLFERENTLSFVPPDGRFELMQYRVAESASLAAPVYCNPNITYTVDEAQLDAGEEGEEGYRGSGSVSIMVGVNPMHMMGASSKQPTAPAAEVVVEDVCVIIPFPPAVHSTDLRANLGSVVYDQANKVCRWEIGRVPKDMAPHLTGSILLKAKARAPREKLPVLLEFKAPMTTISGLKVDSLVITEETYSPYKGVRVMLKSGRYQIRV